MAKRRDVSKELFWRRIIRQQQQSGLPVSRFCTTHDLKACTFHWWRRELAQRDKQSQQETASRPTRRPRSAEFPAFIPVAVTTDDSPENRTPPGVSGDDSSTTIEVILKSGQRLRIPPDFAAPTLQRVLSVLEQHPC